MNDSHLVGADVGGTKIAAGLVGLDGRLLGSSVRPTPVAEGPTAVIEAIAGAVEALTGGGPALGVGVGTGGVIDRDRGTVYSANELLPDWAGTEVAAELGQRLQLPVAVDNDVNAFALAEQFFGAGAGRSSALYASVGTGIGGALVLGGSLHRGAHHTAGEFGHLAVPDADDRPCNCGATGHLEAVGSGPAITARFRQLGGAAVGDLRDVARSAADGDALASRALREGAAALGRALAGLANAIDPELVVLGGGVAEIGDAYWSPLREAFAAEALPGPSGTAIVPADLGSRAAVVGAAALHLETRTTNRKGTPSR